MRRPGPGLDAIQPRTGPLRVGNGALLLGSAFTLFRVGSVALLLCCAFVLFRVSTGVLLPRFRYCSVPRCTGALLPVSAFASFHCCSILRSPVPGLRCPSLLPRLPPHLVRLLQVPFQPGRGERMA